MSSWANFWQAWVYLFVSAAAFATMIAYLKRKDPALLRRRTRGLGAETEASQMLLQVFAMFVFPGTVVLSLLDHRFAWSHVPLFAEIAGFALVILGFFVYFMVLRENTFAGVAVTVVSGQKVITTGPYASVRHPMYSGLLLVLLGTPLALGSWWGLIMFVPMTLIISLRIRYEEKFLMENLPGYVDYCRKRRYRLIPFIC